VANAVAANPVNYLLPCHRVLRADGSIGGYRGGSIIKRELLVWEAAALPDRSDPDDEPADPAQQSS
jgi:AraC family transcriptional regulator of adaptative response/methylated-DNA-[protein]-cysteine methyltransferase